MAEPRRICTLSAGKIRRLLNDGQQEGSSCIHQLSGGVEAVTLTEPVSCSCGCARFVKHAVAIEEDEYRSGGGVS